MYTTMYMTVHRQNLVYLNVSMHMADQLLKQHNQIIQKPIIGDINHLNFPVTQTYNSRAAIKLTILKFYQKGIKFNLPNDYINTIPQKARFIPKVLVKGKKLCVYRCSANVIAWPVYFHSMYLTIKIYYLVK